MTDFHIVIPGRCPTKGSLRPIQRTTGGVYMKDSGLVWQKQAMNELSDAWGERPLLAEPVELRANIRYVWPKKPKYPFPPPDVDKLTRRIMDCLTGTILQDDKWVTYIGIVKAWGNRDEVEIWVDT